MWGVTWADIDWHAWEALATTAIFIGGLWQVLRIRQEARKERTLAICNQYDVDPLLDACLRNLRVAKYNGEFIKNPKAFRSDIAALLNYLDGIAIGIQQGLYIEELARDHLEEIVNYHCSEYLKDDIAKAADFKRSDYRRLQALQESWSSRRSYYKDGLWRRFQR